MSEIKNENVLESVILTAMNNIINENLWAGTPLESYALLDPKNKGIVGEEIIKTAIQKKYSIPVDKRINPGHDAIIKGYKTEVKFSAATKRNYDYKFTFNHIGLDKDWERIIFMGINGDMTVKIVWFTKDDIIQLIKTSNCIRHQQGGNNSKNDDYIVANKNSQILMNHPLAKTLQQW